MRQVQIQVDADKSDRVVELAQEREALQPAVATLEPRDGRPRRLVLVNLPNDAVGAFVEAVADEVEEAEFVFSPSGVIPVQTPLREVDRHVRRVVHRSTMELVLSALQSIGTWKGMLLYAVFSGLVAAYGVTLNASYLLTAAMLIAPMGAPTMVCVIATAIGDPKMFARGALRFVAAIAVLVVAAVLFGYGYGLETSTPMMESVTSISLWTVLLAVVGGAAGAQSQVQSERDSLVSGTATGFLIAVSLSPTSAVMGLGIVLGRWDYVGTMAFVIVLTFFGIVAGGWLSLLLYDVSPGQAALSRSSRRARLALASLVLAATVGAVWWQSGRTPGLLKADVAHEAIRITRQTVDEDVAEAQFIEVTTYFTRPDLDRYREETMLVEVTVEKADSSLADAVVRSAVRSAVGGAVQRELPNVTPIVNVSVLPSARRVPTRPSQ